MKLSRKDKQRLKELRDFWNVEMDSHFDKWLDSMEYERQSGNVKHPDCRIEPKEPLE